MPSHFFGAPEPVKERALKIPDFIGLRSPWE